MLKYFLFSSILFHLTLVALVGGSFTTEDIRSTAWSTHIVTLEGLSGLSGTGQDKASKEDKGIIASPKPRGENIGLRKAPQHDGADPSGQAEKTLKKTETSQADGANPTAGGLERGQGQDVGHMAGGVADTNVTRIPRGQGGFGKGAKGFGIGKTSTLPVALHEVQPVYPHRARQRNITGKVIISCTVNVDGSVADLVVIESFPRGVFDKSACAALKHWSFRPAIHQGRPAASRITVPFRFELD